jgi:circadian clock protein KaiC
MRGAAFREGFHDFAVQRGGIVVFPRVIPREAAPDRPVETLPVENETLRAMVGGGFEFGSSLLISGQSGTGKSTLATLIARSAARNGFPAAMFMFEERPEVMRARSERVGLGVEKHEQDGSLRVAHFDPAEISPGQFSHAVIAQVSAGARVVVIDSLSGYLNALPDRDNVVTHLHSLLQYLARNHVLTVVTLAQHGLLGEPPVTELDTSYLADSIILLRQYEEGAEIRRSIAVLKKRAGMHSRAIQELVIEAGLVDIRPLDVATSRRAGQAAQLSGP